MILNRLHEQFRQGWERATTAAEPVCVYLLGYGLPILLLTCLLIGVIFLV